MNFLDTYVRKYRFLISFLFLYNFLPKGFYGYTEWAGGGGGNDNKLHCVGYELIRVTSNV